MAITVVSAPANHEPVYNYLNYKISSTNVGEPKFKYIFDVYVNAVLIFSNFIAPAADGYGYFDVSRIAENYLSDDGSTLLSGNQSSWFCPNTYIESLQLKFREQYEIAGTLTTSAVLTTGTAIQPFAGALKYYDRFNYSQGSYLATTSSTTIKFLTQMPSGAGILPDQFQWLSALIGNVDIDSFKIDTFDSSGSAISSAKISFNSPLLTTGGRIKRLPVSNANISLISGGSFISGNSLILNDDDIAYYDVYLLKLGAGVALQASEKQRFIVKEQKCKYTPHSFYFKNRFGVFESFVFQLNSTEKVDVSRKYYSKNNPISQLTYTIADRTKTTISTRVSRTYTAQSDWITEDEASWLEELFTSPVVYWNTGDEDDAQHNRLVPVNIINNSYDVLTRNNKKLINISINYELTVLEDTQRS